MLHYCSFSLLISRVPQVRTKDISGELAVVCQHSSQDGSVSASVCACGLAATLLRTQGISAACGLACCALKLSPVRNPFLCNARSSRCCCSAAAQGQPQPSVLGAAFPCTCSLCRASCWCHRAGRAADPAAQGVQAVPPCARCLPVLSTAGKRERGFQQWSCFPRQVQSPVSCESCLHMVWGITCGRATAPIVKSWQCSWV